jgi:hypothetical protein
MAEPDSKDLAATLSSRSAAPVVALVLILATTVGVLNLSTGPSDGTPTSDTGKQAEAPAPPSGPPARAGVADALEALEPLERFLNLESPPKALDELAGLLSGYRVTTLIASLSDPKESRLGYDFDMAVEAIQRAIESEGYTIDRFRFPWLDPNATPAAGGSAPAVAAATPPASSGLRGQRHERQPGVILFRIDRPAPTAMGGGAAPPQDLLLLLLVGETPTWGIQQEALRTSLDIAWTLDVQRKLKQGQAQGEPVIRIVAPTFSGTGDSLARVLRTWAGGDAKRREAKIWVCSGAATAIDKNTFERNAWPAQAIYSATVIPDDILLAELYRFLARPTGGGDPATAPALPEGKIGLLVESGSGYGSTVGNTYGTSGKSVQSRRIVAIPFPSQIAQMRSSTAANDQAKKGKSRVTIPFDPPSGRQSDRLPALSPRMTVATDNLIVGNILATIASEDIRYVGVVATDILDVIYLIRLIRENCPDVQVILVGNDLRYTDPQFTLDFRGTIIASSYPLDARAQVWSYPFEGAIERRLFASEFDIGRYNAALVLINGVRDPNHTGRLAVDAGSAEDFLVYGKPFVGSFLDSVNRRPQIWINQVGQFNVWPLKVMPLSQTEPAMRATAEALIPPVVSLDPHAEIAHELAFDYDLPLIWKLVFCVATFLAFMLASIVLYTNLGKSARVGSRSSWFAPLLQRFAVSTPDLSRKNLFLIAMLVLAVAVPYCVLAAPLDVILPARGTADGEEIVALRVGWDVYALAGLAVVTLCWLLVPLVVCLREVVRRAPANAPPDGGATGRRVDRWLSSEDVLYRLLTAGAVLTGIGCILARLYQLVMVRPELPNDWLALDRSAHLLGGISPIVPVACIGAAIFWWSFLELKRMHCYPLLHRGTDLIRLHGHPLAAELPWKRVIGRLNARFRLCVDLLEYPVTVLISRNLPLAGLVLSAVTGLVVFIWGVVWPRHVPTPEGSRFDLLVVIALLCYLLLLLYSQLRYLWLWRSLLQLFRQISLLPMAGAFDRTPPRVAARFGRFLRTSLDEDSDLEVPLHQCRLVLGPEKAEGAAAVPPRDAVRQVLATMPLAADRERFDAVSNACAGPVIELVWPTRSLHDAYDGAAEDEGKKKDGDQPAPPAAGDTLDPATRQWLGKAEDLLALRIVYMVSQLAGPLRCMSAQLIYGPILLLLAVAWYPFHPQRLMAIMIWAFISGGVLMTLMLLIQVEHADFVSRLARIAPGNIKFDQTMITNLLPYAVPVIGFVLTAFPSLGYWLGSLLEPIGRAVK